MNPSFAQRLFREMLRIRVIEEEIARLYPEQQMRCPVHLCIGQEAIAVGVSASLGDGDYVLGGHRSHGHYLAKGGDLKAMMAELYGKATGCSKGIGGSMHLVDLSVGFVGSSPIVASTLPIASEILICSEPKGVIPSKTLDTASSTLIKASLIFSIIRLGVYSGFSSFFVNQAYIR